MLDFIYDYPVWLQSIIFVVLLVIGVFFLVKFCDLFVDGASSIASKLHISPLVIGLTIVAMGTSCPELAVSVSDSISTLSSGGNANVAIGNVVGSNICNLCIVLGFSAIFTPIIVKKNILKKEFPILLFVSAILVLFGLLFGLKGVSKYAILRFEGIILAVGIVLYITYLIINSKRHPEEAESEGEVKNYTLFKSILFTLIGIVGVILGGEAVVFGAKGIAFKVSDALNWNHDLTESLVGLTIVAVGTSLPELVTSVIAAKKGQNELALGNVIGSNIFNALFVLGISATINPLTTGTQIVIDLIVMMSVTIVTFILSLKGKLKKIDGIILIGMYVSYLTYLILRTIL